MGEKMEKLSKSQFNLVFRNCFSGKLKKIFMRTIKYCNLLMTPKIRSTVKLKFLYQSSQELSRSENQISTLVKP